MEVLKPGLETTVQDYPGRVGVVSTGYPISGPMDGWSFRIANRLVGNEAGAAGLECQFIGPTLRFHDDRVVAVCGAEMPAALDGVPFEAGPASPSAPARPWRSARRHAARAPISRSPAASTCHPSSAPARPIA